MHSSLSCAYISHTGYSVCPAGCVFEVTWCFRFHSRVEWSERPSFSGVYRKSCVRPMSPAFTHVYGVLGGEGAEGGERAQGSFVSDMVHVGSYVFCASTAL